jgi:Coenzyme PQQ synthesis protein D (PqqD)
MERLLETYAPRARQEDLVIEGLDGETLVYDMRTHKAHCLNRTAALVWNHCDGRATVGEMAKVLENELSMLVRAEVVWMALEQLDKAQLLADHLPKSTTHQTISRRAVMRRIGLGAAIALPIVSSILAPTTAEASTCLQANSSCTTNSQCCSGNCNCTGVCICG